MRCPSVLRDESERLKALAQYGLSGERPLPSLDPIVQLAVRAFNVPGAAVNLIGREEVFFAASEGIGACDKSRDISFCAHAITQDDVLVVEDASLDARFHDNPLVTGPNPIRFYAGAPVRSPDGQALGALCLIDSRPRASFSKADRARLSELAKLVSDRLELRRLTVASAEGQGKFGRIAQTSPNGIISCDTAGNITAINAAAEAMFGHSPGDVFGKSLTVLLPAWRASHLGDVLDGLTDRYGPRPSIQQDFIGLRADGTEFPLEIAWSSWIDGQDANFGIVIRDLTDQRRQEDELYRLANFDEATGLANLSFVQRRLREELSANNGVALLMLRAKGLHDIAHTLDHDFADAALKHIASRLRQCVRNTDIVARVGRDQFAIVLAGIGDPLQAHAMAEGAIEAISRLIVIDGEEVRLGASCGVALSPSHADDPDELLGNAGLALQEAERQGSGRPVMFVPAFRMNAVARRMFDAELHRAVDRQELQLFYQPQVRLRDQALTGAEALLRWNHPERGLLAPSAFLPALENSSLASIVGAWIIDTACRDAAAWRKASSPDFRISVNLFAAQLRSGDLRSIIRNALDRHALPPAALGLEITETTVLDDEAVFLPLLEGLREDGIKLAFDDFGTGFASLSLAARYPLTHLKIDKSFVQQALDSAKDRVIVQAITSLAHQLGLQVIAEGVETHRCLEFCKDVGCDEAQGYFFGKPVSARDFETALSVPRAPESIGRSA